MIGGVTRLLGEEMAIKRDHPLTMRRYMWKLDTNFLYISKEYDK